MSGASGASRTRGAAAYKAPIEELLRPILTSFGPLCASVWTIVTTGALLFLCEGDSSPLAPFKPTGIVCLVSLCVCLSVCLVSLTLLSLQWRVSVVLWALKPTGS